MKLKLAYGIVVIALLIPICVAAAICYLEEGARPWIAFAFLGTAAFVWAENVIEENDRSKQ
jgi:hypothetical protein